MYVCMEGHAYIYICVNTYLNLKYLEDSTTDRGNEIDENIHRRHARHTYFEMQLKRVNMKGALFVLFVNMGCIFITTNLLSTFSDKIDGYQFYNRFCSA